jgi:hypothetical protein
MHLLAFRRRLRLQPHDRVGDALPHLIIDTRLLPEKGALHLSWHEGAQTMLTSKHREILCKADINRGFLNNVPLDVLSVLVNDRIVDEQWRNSDGVMVRGTSADAASTHVDRVKLTIAGIRLACSLQGIDKVRCP